MGEISIWESGGEAPGKKLLSDCDIYQKIISLKMAGWVNIEENKVKYLFKVRRRAKKDSQHFVRRSSKKGGTWN